MASTRKSSRVRVPKIKEDAVTPAKRSKTNTLPAATGAATTAAVIVPAAAVAQPQTVATTPPLTVPVTTVNIVSTPVKVPEVQAEEAAEEMEVNSSGFADGTGEEMGLEKVATAIFKDPTFVHTTIGAAGAKRTRVWKNLKQIVATERSLPWQPTDVTYGSIEGPPSFKPAKKYSDLSGLEARYTDPQTKIRYASPEEFTRVRTLPSDLVTGYLALRKASAPVP